MVFMFFNFKMPKKQNSTLPECTFLYSCGFLMFLGFPSRVHQGFQSFPSKVSYFFLKTCSALCCIDYSKTTRRCIQKITGVGWEWMQIFNCYSRTQIPERSSYLQSFGQFTYIDLLIINSLPHPNLPIESNHHRQPGLQAFPSDR